ncbi:MAG TPA: hypothetical protein VEJ87_11630, partial [Acidimicrobiales bacterium]|nr:hypothetical protein [Acidimicrobiales bacterium]
PSIPQNDATTWRTLADRSPNLLAPGWAEMTRCRALNELQRGERRPQTVKKGLVGLVEQEEKAAQSTCSGLVTER